VVPEKGGKRSGDVSRLLLVEPEHPIVRKITETPLDLQCKFITRPGVFNLQRLPDAGQGISQANE
jgi:hypothetical protein